MKDLEEENKRLREIVADLILDNQALKEVIKKSFKIMEDEGVGFLSKRSV